MLVLWVLKWAVQSLLSYFYSTFQVKNAQNLKKEEESLVFLLIKPALGNWACADTSRWSNAASEQPRGTPRPGSSYTPGPAEGQGLQTQPHLPPPARHQNLTGLDHLSTQQTAAFIPIEEHIPGKPRGQSPPLWPCQLLLMWGCVDYLSLNVPSLFQFHLVCCITSLISLVSSKFQRSASCSQLLSSPFSQENKQILYPMVPVNKGHSRSSTSYLVFPIFIIRLSKLIFQSLLMRMPEKAVQLWR